jgi:hypothetical protein
MTVIVGWMREAVRSGSWKRHDDLHLDTIVGAREKGEWVSEAIRLRPEIVAARDEVAPGFAVILAFGLKPSSSPLPPTWSSEAGFVEDMDDYSPPSLYLYEHDTSEWSDVLSDNVSIGVPSFLAVLGSARYRQVWEVREREYWRSLLFVLQLPNNSLQRDRDR